jgi:hypothetical protein
MTTFGLLLPRNLADPQSTKRNRHSVENDLQTAQIKRINRLYAKRECDRKVKVINGVPKLTVLSTGEIRNFEFGTLDNLEQIIKNN